MMDISLKMQLPKQLQLEKDKPIGLKSIGKDSKGDQVSEMDFEWSIKLKG